MTDDQGSGECRACHGTNYRGTVLSYSQADRTIPTEKFGPVSFWRGFQIGCYNCHQGPNSDDQINNQPPLVTNKNLNTPNDVPLPISLAGSDANGNPLTYRIVSQSGHGSVGLVGSLATYFPEPGFVGLDSFTFAAWDGFTNSNLGQVRIAVTEAACAGSATPYGFGCPGSGGFLPYLTLDGCASPGETVTLSLTNGLGGSTAQLFFGLAPAEIMLQAGCVLRISPLLPITVALPLSPGGPGDGSISVMQTIPPTTAAASFALQAFVADPGLPKGWSNSNAVEVDLQ